MSDRDVIQAVAVTIDDEPGVVKFFAESVAHMAVRNSLVEWYHRGNVYYVWRRRASGSEMHDDTLSTRDRRKVHESRRAQLGYVDPVGTFYVFGHVDATKLPTSVPDDQIASVIEAFKRTPEEKMHDAIRAWRADNHLSSDFTLAVTVDQWIRENP